jgi:hypothetical protein
MDKDRLERISLAIAAQKKMLPRIGSICQFGSVAFPAAGSSRASRGVTIPLLVKGSAVALAAWPLVSHAQGTFSVHFEQPNYLIQPGGTIPVNVVIDPLPSSGLFSYGVNVNFDPARALLESMGIHVPPPLDFNGVLGPGALAASGTGFAAVKGTVSFSVQPLTPYSGALLATFLVTDKSALVGSSYTLGLSLFRTLGPGETVFVDGKGNSLDGSLAFGSTLIEVVPEPGTVKLLALGGCCCLLSGGLGGYFGKEHSRC